MLLGAASPAAHAWDKHQLFMPWVARGLNQRALQALGKPIIPPCLPQDLAMYRNLAAELKLNPKVVITPTAPEACLKGTPVLPMEILRGPSVDDPDNGMDENMDISPDQRFMGGTTGPTSKGFRHMYFGGWKLDHPVATFQIPIHGLGDAPRRAELLADKAKQLLRSGDMAWGARLLAWSMHYVQDLAQPFHSAQVPDLGMVPWGSLLKWPPSAGFDALVKDTTHSIANYHWAYEAYVLNRMQASGDNNPFVDCLANPAKHQSLGLPAGSAAPIDIARAVAASSVELAPTIGSAELRLFGKALMGPEYDLPSGIGSINYDDLAIRTDVMYPRLDLEKATCTALANAVYGSQRLVEWALQP